MSCRRAEREPAGVVDENGVLWKATQVGKLTDGFNSCTEIYQSLAESAKTRPEKCCAGQRPILETHQVDGFEQVVLGDYEWQTYGQYFKTVEDFGSGLAKTLSLHQGDTVVIYADTQRAWMQAAYGAWRQGLVVGTIYATLGEEAALYGINQSKAKAVIADAKLLKVLASVAGRFTSLKVVVAIKEPDEKAKAALVAAGITIHLMDDLIAVGAEAPQPATPASSDDTAVLMYTSGTCGNPKGVLISHKAILSVVGATASDSSATTFKGTRYIRPSAVYLAYLPLAHIMELAVEITLYACGVTVGYGTTGTVTPTAPKMFQTTPPQLGDAQALKPTMFVAAPAVLDKVFVAVKTKFEGLSGLLNGAAMKGLERGRARFARDQYGTSGLLAGLVFKKVKKLLGGRIEVMLTGSAPLSADVQIFMQTVFGCPVRQGYGLTETCAASCITLGVDNSRSVVGPPQESACIRLRDWEEGHYRAADKDDPKIGMRRGEVLIGGPTVCKGYLVDAANPDPEIVQKNVEDFVTIDGIRYFCTGDIGQFTPDGNLMIIDRKKDLVKLSMGEYVALSKVENVLKACKYTQLPMVHASSTMAYCIALICPVVPKLEALAAELAVEGDLPALCANPKVRAAVTADAIATCKALKLSKFEIPTKIVLVPELWTPDNGMLTAVNKLKRKPIVEKHAADISDVYV